MKIILTVFLVTLSMMLGFVPAFAHKTVTVEQYDIEVGWRDEPPLVGQQNAVFFSITQDEGNGVKSGVTNAFKDLEAEVKSGSTTKQLDILSDIRVGNYYSKIIPTKTGSLTVILKGTLEGIPVDEEVTIEGVESIDLLAFPPSGSSSGQDTVAIKNALSVLQRDMADVKAKIGNVQPSSNIDLSKTYDSGIFGIAIGTAGVILAVISMLKRK
ncbi:MAG: hypothetical protein HZA84_02635 [Thaumarchaeota archaeon]|nr:hypothetical protein [Nitrososphaerota archaeon]